MKRIKNTTNLRILAASFVIIGCVFLAGGLSARSTSMHICARFQSGDLSPQRTMTQIGITSESQLETDREKRLFRAIGHSQKLCVSLCTLLVNISNCLLVLGAIHLFLGTSGSRFVGKMVKQVGNEVLNGSTTQANSLGTIPQQGGGEERR